MSPGRNLMGNVLKVGRHTSWQDAGAGSESTDGHNSSWYHMNTDPNARARDCLSHAKH